VDQLGPAIERARAEAGRRIPRANLEFRCEPFEAGRFREKSFQLVACLGATHAVGNLEAALRVLSRLVPPGGLMLVADGYWRRTPDPEYLEFLGATPDELRTHEGNLSLARGLGMSVLRSHQATGAEWSHYEDTYAESLMRFVTGHPEDPDAREMGDWIQAWRHAYLRWGRDTLGFALYLLRR